MIPCVVMGDSLAVGVGHFRPECQTVAKVGITSDRYVQTLLVQHQVATAIISLGVNDDFQDDTIANLRLVRAEVGGARVIWLLPGINRRARHAIHTVAAEFGDRVIETGPYAGRDHLHPSGVGYEILAAQTR